MSGDEEQSRRVSSVSDALAAGEACADFLLSTDLYGHGDPAALLEQLTALQRRIDAVVLRAVETFDTTQAWQRDGAASAAAWLRANLRMTHGSARQTVRTARRLRQLPMMESALREGAISRDHVQVVTGAMARTPQREATVSAAEPTFCEAAKRLDPSQLARVVTRWTHTVDPLGALENEQVIHAQRYLSASRTFDGAVKLDALLGPEQGAVVMTALEAVATSDHRTTRAARGDASGADDDRTSGQRRADAFVDLCRSYLDVGFAPEIAGVRPHVQLTVPLEALATRRSARGEQDEEQVDSQRQPEAEPAELGGVGPISSEAARRISCDALIAAMGLDVTGAPLTYGRSMRTVDPRLRKVLNERDRGCRFPGCDRPVAWCQAHHLVHWAHGGGTDPDNLALICSFHHHRLHEGGFTTRGSPADRTLTFHRPDGTRIRDPERDPRRTT